MSVVVDRALLLACESCKVDPTELKSRPRDDFKMTGLSDEAVDKRFMTFQEQRIRKLFLVATERKRILYEAKLHDEETARQEQQRRLSQDGRKSPPRSPKKLIAPRPPLGHPSRSPYRARSPVAGGGSDDGGAPASERSADFYERDTGMDDIIQRTMRQRQFWDSEEERQRKVRERREQETADRIKQTQEFTHKDRVQSQLFNQQRLEIQKLNQDIMRQRWQRDEELLAQHLKAQKEETERREQLLETHLKEVHTARERRQQKLVVMSRVDSDERTEERLRKAKELRQQADEAVALRAAEQIAAVEKRREEHVVRGFLDQVDLANRALRERKKAEATLMAARQKEDERIQQTEVILQKKSQTAERVRSASQLEASRRRRAVADHQMRLMVTSAQNRDEIAQQKAAEGAERQRRLDEKRMLREQHARERALLTQEERDEAARLHAARTERSWELSEREHSVRERRLLEKHQRVEERLRKIQEIRQHAAAGAAVGSTSSPPPPAGGSPQ